MDSPAAAKAWLAANPDAFSEGATFVVGLDGFLRLAPRRSEHVACASGGEVLAPGEMRFAEGPRAVDASNQSTGDCPDVSSWPAVAAALARAGIAATNGFTSEIVFRRCRGRSALVEPRVLSQKRRMALLRDAAAHAPPLARLGGFGGVCVVVAGDHSHSRGTLPA